MAASIPNLELIYQTGLDPRSRLPLKLAEITSVLKDSVNKQLRVNDLQLAVNRYTWGNLPKGLYGQLLERILYYRGSAAFFYNETLDQFFFLPYALQGNLDVYGRYISLTPLTMAGSTASDVENGKIKEKPWIPGLELKAVYEVVLPEDLSYNMLTESAVLLNDYTAQISKTFIPRYKLNDAFIDAEADCIPFMHTALLNSTGIEGVRIDDENMAPNVAAANSSTYRAALQGHKYIPITAPIELQEISAGAPARAEEFMLAMQSMDNYRLGLYGLENGGVFEKKAHVLASEQAMNASTTGLVMQDGLTIRQRFCDIINSIWGLGIWVEPSENVQEMDLSGDGKLMDQTQESEAAQDERME